MIVMMMASTPSLNASRRPVRIAPGYSISRARLRALGGPCFLPRRLVARSSFLAPALLSPKTGARASARARLQVGEVAAVRAPAGLPGQLGDQATAAAEHGAGR